MTDTKTEAQGFFTALKHARTCLGAVSPGMACSCGLRERLTARREKAREQLIQRFAHVTEPNHD
jgi:hypothetical protein